MAKIEIKCVQCGAQFLRSASKIKGGLNFCGRACHAVWRSRRIEVRCAWCEANMSRSASKIKGGLNFCGRRCKGKWNAANVRGETSPRYKGRVEVNCTMCNNAFLLPPSRLHRNKNLFCGRRCKDAWQVEGLKGEKSPRYRKVRLQCAVCKKDLARSPCFAKTERLHFCGGRCYGEWVSENKCGENNPSYISGKTVTDRGPNWKKQRELARCRDGHKCQVCGVTREENGRELDVHHRVPFRDFGYIRGTNRNYLQANELENLVSVCCACHGKMRN